MRALAAKYADEPDQGATQDQGGDDDPVTVAAEDFIRAVKNGDAGSLPEALTDLLDAIGAGGGQGGRFRGGAIPRPRS